MPEFLPAISLDELPQEGIKALELKGQCILLVRLRDHVLAWKDRCPHAGAPLRIGKRRDEELTCAWHGWVFNLVTGQSVPDQPSYHLTSIPVKIEGSQVLLAL